VVQDAKYSLSFNKKNNLLTSKLELNLRNKLLKLYIWCTALWCWKLDTSENISEIPEGGWNVVLEKDWEDHLDLSWDKWSVKM